MTNDQLARSQGAVSVAVAAEFIRRVARGGRRGLYELYCLYIWLNCCALKPPNRARQ